MNTVINIKIGQIITEWLIKLGISDNFVTPIRFIIMLTIVILFAFFAYIITEKIIVKFIARFVKKSKNKWDDILYERKVFRRIAQIAPVLVVYYAIVTFLVDYPSIVSVAKSVIYIYLIIMGVAIMNVFFDTIYQIYANTTIARNRPIKGLIQSTKIFIYFSAIILILSILLGKSPKSLLAGLGALAAVLMLVFKDTILGFVSSIQLSANDMVKVGDWISMPSHHSDGVVTEINLNTVKVQNWDKTISTIPTYALVSESFNNWKGMEESGGRRIKRSINIDMKSVKFCSKEMLIKFQKIKLLSSYIIEKQSKFDDYNKSNKVDDSTLVNGRRLTNIGVFRKYVEEYLKQEPNIHNDMTFLVRQLQPTEKGIPLEIYVFSKSQEWSKYEEIQANIFDHVLAIISEFDLNIFQNPTGSDFQKIIK
ncbi:MAG: mechanosensitive ion channel [Bacteroidetes bacterium]|nr:mechanosensitive ion channel [Bacteroidota bacterium]